MCHPVSTVLTLIHIMAVNPLFSLCITGFITGLYTAVDHRRSQRGSVDYCDHWQRITRMCVNDPNSTHVRPRTVMGMFWLSSDSHTRLGFTTNPPETARVKPTTGKMDHWLDAGSFPALTPHMSGTPQGRITGWMWGCFLPWHHTCQTHHWERSLGGWGVLYCPDTTHVRPTIWRDYWVDVGLFTALMPHMSDPPLGGIRGGMRGHLLPWHYTCQTHHW